MHSDRRPTRAIASRASPGTCSSSHARTRAGSHSVPPRSAHSARRAGRLPLRSAGTIEVGGAAGTRVTGDSERIEQALGNLVENALVHGDSTVRIVAQDTNGHVELHVLDEGPGFRDGFAERAFDRFGRADDGWSTAGTGLGLAIARAILGAHGGDSGARSRNDRSGADVWLSTSASAACARGTARARRRDRLPRRRVRDELAIVGRIPGSSSKAPSRIESTSGSSGLRRQSAEPHARAEDLREALVRLVGPDVLLARKHAQRAGRDPRSAATRPCRSGAGSACSGSSRRRRAARSPRSAPLRRGIRR